VLILNSGIRVQVDRLGWMLITHPRGVSNGYVFTPQESKQIFETLKSVQGHETFYSPSAFKENGNHSHE
jgi:hypothetical protein